MLRARPCTRCHGPNYRISDDICKHCARREPDTPATDNPPVDRFAKDDTVIPFPRKPYNPNPLGTVYALASGDAIKIGFTTHNIRSRIAALKTGNPNPITLLAECDGYPRDERRIHLALHASRVSGEWFAPSIDTLRVVEAMKRGSLTAPPSVRSLLLSNARILPFPPCSNPYPTSACYAFNQL